MRCIARCKSNLFKQCSFKISSSCNKFCNKHINEVNVETIEKNLFNEKDINIFIMEYINICDINTKKSQLFLKKNIVLVKYILQYYNYNFNINLKNKDVIIFFKNYISDISKYKYELKRIIKIQSIIRRKNIYHINNLKGPGWTSICVNDSDFYTFEEKKYINYDYFFSFKDEKNSIYFFDIRSFKLLLDNQKSNNIINPYNRLEISLDNIHKYNKLIRHLKTRNISIDFEPEVLSEEQSFNQIIIKIFQKIDTFGYNTSIEWFTQLSIFQLRKLWVQLEDIWNYRSNLSLNEKNNIVQKIKPQPFSKFKLLNTKYFYDTNKLINKKKLQEAILDDFNIFLSSGINEGSSNIGCLYVLTALSSVSNKCIESMPWLQQ